MGRSHLHDGNVAIVLAALDIEDGRVAIHPEARDVQPRAHQAARVVPQIQDEALGPASLHANSGTIHNSYLMTSRTRFIRCTCPMRNSGKHAGLGRWDGAAGPLIGAKLWH